MSEPETVQKFKPLSVLMESYLWLHQRISIRANVLGVDPSKSPKWLRERKKKWLTRSTFVDLYAMVWPLLDCLLLWLVMTRLRSNATIVLVVVILIYRLNELFGGIFWVLINRASEDYADGRKLVLTLLNYFEPILLFGALDAAVSAIFSNTEPQSAHAGYFLDHKNWNWVTILDYSVGRYTTVGVEGVSPISALTTILSDIETIVGIIMLALTISVFVSRAIAPKPSQTTK